MNTLRWILILPLSFVISAIFPYLSTLFVGFFIDAESTFWKTLFSILFNYMQGYSFITASYAIAPSFKKQTSFIFLIMWISFVVLVSYALKIENIKENNLLDVALLILGSLSAYITIVLNKDFK